MTIIDCTGKSGFGKKKVKQFSNLVNDNEEIELVIDDKVIFKTNKSSLISDIFLNENCKNLINNGSLMSFRTNNVELTFIKETFNWWTKTNDRIELFRTFIDTNYETKKEKTTNKASNKEYEKQYSIGIATIIDNELTNIHHFKGSKEDCINFINDDMFQRYIDETLKAKIVINLAFDEDEFNTIFNENSSKEAKDNYKKNLEMWYTIQELEDIGAITTK